MTYTLKISSKNQVTIPVALLKDLGIKKSKNKEKTTDYLLVVKNLQGKYEIVNPFEILRDLQGSLQAPKHLQNLSDEELENLIEKAKTAHIKSKYSY
jgi:bifunctional DNA-binding transcriptional regulator/antitoxin component of YhaV-PrlF toxin-antitoxin module